MGNQATLSEAASRSIGGCGRLLWDRFEFSEKPNDRSAGIVVECEHVDQVGEAGGLISWVI